MKLILSVLVFVCFAVMFAIALVTTKSGETGESQAADAENDSGS